jgi:spore germination cell wall hydrolase CwlJ-like protein
MAFRVKSFTKLHANQPPPEDGPSRTLSPGTILDYVGKDEDKSKEWINVAFTPPAGVKAVGWVRNKDCEEVPDAPRPEIAEVDFIRECYATERTFNSPVNAETISHWVISGELLIARAVFETGIKNVGAKPGSDGVGPLRVTSAEWDVFLRDGGPLVGTRKPEDRDHPTLQIRGAAWSMHADIQAISEAKAAKGVGTADEPFMPTYLDVFHAYLLNDPKAAVVIIDAQATDDGKKQTIDKTLESLGGTTLDALFAARGDFLGTKASPKSVADFLTATEDALAKALKKTFDLTKELAPDELPKVPAPPDVVVAPVDTSGLTPVPAEPPFATSTTPLDQMFWPVVTDLRQAMVVSYKDSAGKIVGSSGRCFFANRNGGSRHHVGMDIYCKESDAVVACADGTVVNYYPFYRTKRGEQSFALFVAHAGVVINYGEVKGGAPVQKGKSVKAGDKIGVVSSTDMIHFETYVPGTTQNSRWLRGGTRPASLLNPTKLLLDLAANATRILPDGSKVPGGGSAQVAQGSKPLSVSESDVLTLARTIYGEARGEKPEGREAVAHVVMNRVARHFRGNTISEVCLSPAQFSCFNKNDVNRPLIIGLNRGANAVFDECINVAEQVIAGQFADNTGGATHYYSVSIAPPNWTKPPAVQTAKIGSHLFFKNVP